MALSLAMRFICELSPLSLFSVFVNGALGLCSLIVFRLLRNWPRGAGGVYQRRLVSQPACILHKPTCAQLARHLFAPTPSFSSSINRNAS